MHVLYLIDSLIAGGAERSLAALAPAFAARGVQLDVGYLYERDNVWKPVLEDAGAQLFSLAGAQGMPGAVRRAHALLRSRRPDVLHTTLFDADVVGRIAAMTSLVPVVTSLVNEAYGDAQRRNPDIKTWKLRAAQFVDAATARRVTRFHAVSENVAATAARRLHVSPQKIDVIPRGRDPKELGERDATRRARVRRSLGAETDDELVLAVGRHEFQKGFDVLVAAFARVRVARPRARLLIAGPTGNVTPDLERAIRDAGLEESVHLLGFRSDVPDLLCGADVFASSSRWEGSPGSVIEAMALEVPIVASDIPAVREVVRAGEEGVLVAVDDADALARGIESALASPDPARTAAARTRFLGHFTIDRVADAMVDLYERVRSRGDV